MTTDANTTNDTGNDDRFCFAWALPETSKGRDRQGLFKAAQWPQRSTITISFLDGAPELQARVEEAARSWIAQGLAKLNFSFLHATRETDIRISFRYRGSWSLVGTDCQRETNLSRPTMNFGRLTLASSDQDLRAVVLHEFGHALGLLHEHQIPEHGINWHKQNVYDDLSGPPNYWDKDMIDRNVFESYSKVDVSDKPFDPESIMIYPFPAHWTTDGFSVKLKTDLSDNDKSFIAEHYR